MIVKENSIFLYSLITFIQRSFDGTVTDYIYYIIIYG